MHTPNHDDHQLRYSYRLQPTIIWWNLTRLGEALGELMGSTTHVDDPTYISGEYSEEQKAEVVKQGERIIEAAGEEFKAVFLQEYKQLMQQVSPQDSLPLARTFPLLCLF
jgi:serine/tyrosine/threonine adenylyltransferase